ncbi:MAG TPA: hypothetical protein PK340_00090 [Bacilli bacterium]|jgi:GNAT superfamily N-acetyltransferase|nr:hypothetical protein [Bacilli bacterium]
MNTNLIEIKIVTTKRELRRFIDFPVKLYKGNPYFTPYIFEDEMNNLTPEKNPASRYCDFRLFLAYKGKKIVGRVAAIINRYSNDKYNQKRIRFNRIDMIDDIEVTKALIGAVAEYGKANGLDEIAGPLGYSDQDKEGLLTYGFEEKNMFVTFYTHAYYVRHLNELGFVPDAVWNEYKVFIPKEIDPRFVKIAEYTAKKYNVKIVRPKSKRMKDLKPYIHEILHLMNRTYDHLYGYVPIPEDVMDHLAAQYVPMVNLDYLQIVTDVNEKIIGFSLMIPSPSDALKKSKGHLYPFGFIGFLKALKHAKHLDMLLVAVEPEYKNTGVLAMMFTEAIRNAMKNGVEYAETGPELSDNSNINLLWKSFEHVKHKQRTCFVRPLEWPKQT